MRTFNPDPDKDYGICKNCGVSLKTQDDTSAHLVASRHTVRITNPSRASRIRDEVDWITGSHALYDAIDELWELVADSDATEDEITDSIISWDRLRDEWVASVLEERSINND